MQNSYQVIRLFSNRVEKKKTKSVTSIFESFFENRRLKTTFSCAQKSLRVRNVLNIHYRHSWVMRINLQNHGKSEGLYRFSKQH